MLLLGLFVLALRRSSACCRSARERVIAPGWAWLAGLAGGITSTVFGAGGPPYAIYLSQRGLTKEQYRATMGFATLTSISLRAVAFLLTGLLLDAGRVAEGAGGGAGVPRRHLGGAAHVPAHLARCAAARGRADAARFGSLAYFSSSALSASRSRRTHCVSSTNFSSVMPGWRNTVSSTSAPSPLGNTRIGM